MTGPQDKDDAVIDAISQASREGLIDPTDALDTLGDYCAGSDPL